MEIGLEKEKQEQGQHHDELPVRHFSHEHPLKRTKPNIRTSTASCSGCKHTIPPTTTYLHYACTQTNCSFALHRLCYAVPRKTQHPAHKPHPLTLLATDSTTERAFKCKACGNRVSGLYYTCAECGLYYHILCSALPLTVSTRSHPHPLSLEFSPPYDFFCDLCGKPSYKGWLYRCNLCEFDTHLECAVSSAVENRCEEESCDELGLLEMISTSYVVAKSAPALDDQTTPSYHSDSYFSLDLAKSYTDQVVVVGGKKQGLDHTMSRGSDGNLSSKALLGGGIQILGVLGQKKDQPAKPEAASPKRSSCFPFC